MKISLHFAVIISFTQLKAHSWNEPTLIAATLGEKKIIEIKNRNLKFNVGNAPSRLFSNDSAKMCT